MMTFNTIYVLARVRYPSCPVLINDLTSGFLIHVRELVPIAKTNHRNETEGSHIHHHYIDVLFRLVTSHPDYHQVYVLCIRDFADCFVRHLLSRQCQPNTNSVSAKPHSHVRM